MPDPRKIRLAANVTQIVAAVRSSTSLTTVRLYESNPLAVSEQKRRALDAYYLELEATTVIHGAPAGVSMVQAPRGAGRRAARAVALERAASGSR